VNVRTRFRRMQVGILGLAVLAATASSSAATGSVRAVHTRTVTIYTVATGVQFINTADDRARGASNNPFNAATDKLRPSNGSGVGPGGPGPGDVAVYSFDVYSGSSLKRRAGTAAYTCYFNYGKKALCQAYYELEHRPGTILAAGPVSFDDSGFRLVVTGGTKAYLAAQGQVTSTSAAHNSQRVVVSLAGGSAASARGADDALTVYAVPATAQFMNHADDRVRGMTTNPFNVKSSGLVIIAKGAEKGNGPFPGDDVLYTFKLYANGKLKQRVGSAMFTCYYNFVKHATCDSYFQLGKRLVLASGQVAFDAKTFALGVSGGTSKYLGVVGEVTARPGTRNSEQLVLRLQELTR
jgi:hypothetical protein